MKNKTIFLSTVIAGAAMLLFYSACKKQSECANIDEVPDSNVYFQFKNKQGQDLLNPATPGHYDVALITQLNPGIVAVFAPPNMSPGVIAIMGTVAPTTRIISLSNTDRDTVFTAGNTVTTACLTYTALTDIKYNGVAVTNGNQYTVIK